MARRRRKKPPPSPKPIRVSILALRKDLLAQFRANGCARCGEKNTVVLQAHHINPLQKLYNIGALMQSSSLDVLRAELKKCVCLCANCHKIIHATVHHSYPRTEEQKLEELADDIEEYNMNGWEHPGTYEEVE